LSTAQVRDAIEEIVTADDLNYDSTLVKRIYDDCSSHWQPTVGRARRATFEDRRDLRPRQTSWKARRCSVSSATSDVGPTACQKGV
jgi:hypothetical protein